MAKRHVGKRVNRGLKPQIDDDMGIGEVEQPSGPAKTGSQHKKQVKVKSDGPLPVSSRPVHDYDASNKRRLTKKAMKSLEVWSSDGKSIARDQYFQRLAAEGKTKFGSTQVLAGSETNMLVVGIPLPSLAWEWLIQQDVWPLSRVSVLCGPPGTCKSALLYEIFRWFAKYNGGGILQEVETKFSPDLCSSIMGQSIDECALIVNRCGSVEDWQDKQSYFIELQKQRLVGNKDAPGPGRTIPICFGVDSLVAKAAMEKQDRIAMKGHAGRDFPLEALLVAEYMRATIGEYDDWPFSLVLVNHLKKGVNRDTNRETRTKPGGQFADYQESFEFEMGIWKNHIETTDFNGRGIHITCMKNSLGETGRRILTRMLWWDEPVDGVNRAQQQKTIWDWDWSTIHLLINLSGKYKQRLKDAGFSLSVRSPKADVEHVAQCPNVGMGGNDWEPFHVVGAMIRENQELMDLLRDALGIKRRALMKGDYLRQLWLQKVGLV